MSYFRNLLLSNQRMVQQWNVDIPEIDIVKVLYGITNNQTDRNLINHLLSVDKTMIFQCRKNVNMLTNLI